MQEDVFVKDNKALTTFNFTPMSFEEALTLAIERLSSDTVETAWFGSGSSAENAPLLRESHIKYKIVEELAVEATPEAIFKSISCIGGENGWYFANRVWSIRAFIDRISGGWGFRRGRRSQSELQEWDIIDFWRVEEIDNNKLITFHAEMEIPGHTWLQFEIVPNYIKQTQFEVVPTDETKKQFEIVPKKEKQTLLILRSFYQPATFLGHVLWYALLPTHPYLYKGMLRQIAAVARKNDEKGLVDLACETPLPGPQTVTHNDEFTPM